MDEGYADQRMDKYTNDTMASEINTGYTNIKWPSGTQLSQEEVRLQEGNSIKLAKY